MIALHFSRADSLSFTPNPAVPFLPKPRIIESRSRKLARTMIWAFPGQIVATTEREQAELALLVEAWTPILMSDQLTGFAMWRNKYAISFGRPNSLPVETSGHFQSPRWEKMLNPLDIDAVTRDYEEMLQTEVVRLARIAIARLEGQL